MNERHNFTELPRQATNLTEMDQKKSFWVRIDFLKLKQFVSFGIIKAYYSIFLLTIAFFMITLVLLLFPVDFTYNNKTNQLMTHIEDWIRDEKVR